MHTFYFFLYSFFIFLQSLCFYTSVQFYIFVYTFCALCSFTHFVLYGFCGYCSYTLLLLCSYENSLRRIKYSSNPQLFRLLKYSVFNSFPSSNTVSEATSIAYHSLCSISLSYGMPCIAIARQVLPTQPFFREPEDFPKGCKYHEVMPLPTCLVYLQPKGITWWVLFIC